MWMVSSSLSNALWIPLLDAILNRVNRARLMNDSASHFSSSWMILELKVSKQRGDDDDCDEVIINYYEQIETLKSQHLNNIFSQFFLANVNTNKRKVSIGLGVVQASTLHVVKIIKQPKGSRGGNMSEPEQWSWSCSLRAFIDSRFVCRLWGDLSNIDANSNRRPPANPVARWLK